MLMVVDHDRWSTILRNYSNAGHVVLQLQEEAHPMLLRKREESMPAMAETRKHLTTRTVQGNIVYQCIRNIQFIFTVIILI